MASIQELTDRLGSGWKIIEPKPQEQVETKPNPAYDPLTNKNVPQFTQQGTGLFYVIVAAPDGQQRALYMRPGPIVGPSPQGAQAVKVTGQDLPTGTSAYTGDLANLNVWEQAGAVADVPKDTTKDVSKLEDLRKIDADGNDASKSGKPAAKLYDDKTGQSYPIDRDKPSYTSFGDDLVQINPDGTTKTLLSKPDKPTTTTVPGVGLVEYDPATHTAKTIAAAPKGLQANQLQPRESNGKTYIPYDTDEGVAWKEAEGLPANVTWTSATNDPRSQYIQLIGSNGETKNIPKPPDWKPPPSPQAGEAITPDTISPFVVTRGDNGQPVFTENKNQQSISEAQKDLIQQLGGKVADGSMTEQQAKDLIASTTSAMTAQASKQNAAANMLQAQTQQQQLGVTAAQNALTQVNQAAQTGAGLLQNRVTAGTGALNNAISAIAGSKMTSAPAGMGANLTGGLSEWVTQLGGGQPVYDSAAAMVNQANPAVKGDPTVAQQAYTALRGAMDLYKQQTGQEWQPKFNAPTTTGTPTQTTAPPQPTAPQLANQNAAAQQLAQATAQTQMPFGSIGANPMAAAQQRIAAPVQPSAPSLAPTMPFGAIAANPMAALQPLPMPAQPYPFRAPVTA
jgi:hypothetical protein